MSAKKRVAAAVATVASGLGLTRLQQRRRRSRRDFRVYILEYHAVAAQGEAEGVVSAERFRRHAEWIQARWRCVTVAQAAEKLQGGLDEDLLVFSFDDGYADNARVVFPILSSLGVPGTIYLATGFLDGKSLWFDLARRGLAEAVVNPELAKALKGRELLGRLLEGWPTPLKLEAAMQRLKDAPARDREAAATALLPLAERRAAKEPMRWQEARELQAAGFELGAHTVDHPILSKLDENEQEGQIAGSIERIEMELGQRPRTFAMPNGSARDYDDATLRVIRRLGLLAACTTRRGSNAAGCDLHQLRRIGIGSDSLAMLDARLTGLFDEGLRRVFSRP